MLGNPRIRTSHGVGKCSLGNFQLVNVKIAMFDYRKVWWYICRYVYIYMCVCVYIYMYIYVYVCIYIYMYISIIDMMSGSWRIYHKGLLCILIYLWSTIRYIHWIIQIYIYTHICRSISYRNTVDRTPEFCGNSRWVNLPMNLPYDWGNNYPWTRSMSQLS